MSKSKERKARLLEQKQAKYGYFHLFRMKDIYPFQLWMQATQGYRLYITEGRELARLYKDGVYIHVWYDEKLKKCCCNRLGMGMYITWDYHVNGHVG